MNVAIVGTGLIGQAWAIVFARGGCAVRLWDGDRAALKRALPLISRQVNELQKQRLLTDSAGIMARIQSFDNLDEALDGAEYVQESLPEVLAIKKEIFSKLDKLSSPNAVLASSTSSIPASAFTENLPGRARCLVAHPVNPPYLIPAVELCGAPWTDKKAVETARSIMAAVKQKPVVVNKELEGFVLNRLQGALLREAFRLVQGGYVSVEDLDVTVKDGLGLRWSFMGPFETIDLNAPDGLEDYCRRYGGMYQSISKEQTDTNAWDAGVIANIEKQRREQIPKSELLNRRLWRDERLMALLRQKMELNSTEQS